MNFNEYQESVLAFRLPRADPMYAVLGLAGEAGEVCGAVAKGIRDGILDEDAFGDNLMKELGDVLWFIAAIADDLNLTLEQVAQCNYDKLASRAERGALGGSGDNR